MKARRPVAPHVRCPYPVPAKAGRAAEDPRKLPRLASTDLQTVLGDVVDLSRGGMRVRMKGRPPEGDSVLIMTLRHPEGRLAVKARVVWSRSTGFRRHEVGFRFEDVTAERAAGITAMARLATKSGLLKALAFGG